MSTQSVANNSAGPTQSQIPAIRTFQFDESAIGQIKNGVNYFRGSLQMPIDLVQLTGREGLDVKVTIAYNSSIKNEIDAWNSEAPTGVIGLGWEMPSEYISVVKAGSGSSNSDSFYLLANGSANPLVKTSEQGSGVWVFQTRNYEFWDIRYDSANEVWTIVKEDGFIHTYGGRTGVGSLQYGVKWGNWIGSSGQLAGQEQYCAAWNLASIESPWGDRIAYSYDNVEQEVAQGGAKFTQASYLSKVVDSFGRTLQFTHGEKYGEQNPSPRGIVEYQAQNTDLPAPNAYQERYETRYLDSIEVRNAQGQELYRLKFVYDFINMAIASDPAYPLLWKRCLKSFYQYSPVGTSQPGMEFDYAGTNDVNRGALRSVTYPTGGVLRIEYKKMLIDAPKRTTVSNPLSGSTPGVWQGDNYVVFTFCQPRGAGIKVLVRTWDGRWVESDITAPGMAGITADPGSVRVLTRPDFIALSFRNTAASQDELYIYQRDREGFGEWKLFGGQPFLLQLKSRAGESSFTAGTDFAVAYNKDYTTDVLQTFSYSWQTGQWTRPYIKPDMGGETGAVVAAAQNYYIVARYFDLRHQAQFQILYRDLQGDWQRTPPWSANNFQVAQSGGRLLLALNAQPSYVAVTHVTGMDSAKIDYRIDIFNWDEAFYVLNASNPAFVELETAASGRSQYDVFRTIVSGAFVNNYTANLRLLGQYGSGVNWVKQDFSRPAADSIIQAAAGEDVAVLCENSNSGQKNKLLTFNPNFPDSGWQTQPVTSAGRYPTVSGDFLTVGKTVYWRDFKGVWTPLQQQLDNCAAEETVQNRAPNYIAYQDTSKPDARSYFVAIKNGQADPPTELPGGPQRIYVSPGESCAGPGASQLASRFLVSYSAPSFCEADKLFLLNLDETGIGDFAYDYPVANVEVVNDYDPAQSFVQSYFYMNSSEAQIGYNSLTGVTQYPLVYEVPGVKSALETPPQVQPYGRSERYYSNGLSPQSGLYPATWIYNYQNILNGMLLAQKDFNSENGLVSSQLNYWQVYTDDVNAGANLYGGYVRSVQTTISTDGIESTSTSAYDPTTGVQLWQELRYYDSDGNAKFQRSEKKYAWQVREYSATFLQRHIYTAVAQNTVSVSASGGAARNYVKSDVITYRNWADDNPSIECPNPRGALCKLAPYQQFQWMTPGVAEPTFQFALGAANPGWLMTSAIVTRAKEGGAVIEQRDVNGVPRSSILDKHQRYLVADFPDGSLRGDEVSYYGFEDYEDGTGWTLGPGAKIVPGTEDSAVDAHLGTRSLLLAASTTGKNGLSRTFHPARQGMKYIFAAWVKKPAGFNNALGNALWQVNVAGGVNASLAFPDVVGEWSYVYQVVDVPNGSGGVDILGQNLNTASGVLVDDVRFSPFNSQFEGVGYDTLWWQANAGLGANGECDRTVHDSGGRPVAATNGADRLTKIESTYFSRSGNEGRFSTADPNCDSAFQPASGGSMDTFTRGSQWQALWRPSPDVWVVEKTRLTQKSPGLPGSLSVGDPRYNTDYVLSAEVETREPVTRPLGVRIGKEFIVQYDPKNLAWELLDGKGQRLAGPADTRLFAVPTTPFASELQNGQVSEALRNLFDRAGYPLPAGTTVGPGQTAEKSWVLKVPNGEYRYDLLQDGGIIGVNRLAGGWTAVVADRVFVFRVAGRKVFSYEAPHPLTDAAPEFFFGNRVAISSLAIGFAPHAELSYKDASGNVIQMQALADDRCVVTQTITDSMGNQAVRTKSAYIAPGVNPALTYCPGFASLRWDTGKMTGLVNDAYPEDLGFPYSRETYERSPRERVVERGAPGELFRVGAHSTRIQYTGQDGKFHKTITTNPNNEVYYDLENDLGQVISRVSLQSNSELKSQTVFDESGNPSARRSPNYFLPPAGSVPSDWVDSQTFDYAGRVTSSRMGTQGETRYIYDRAGNVRFMQDPQGAQDGNFNYVKYDLLARQIETGYVTGVWDERQLRIYADTDPAWPPTPPTWRKKYVYDGGQDIRFAIGRVIEVQVNNTSAGKADVVERFAYDILGNTTVRSLIVDDFQQNSEHRVDYEYDNLSAVTRITYPDTGGGARLNIYQRNNRLNQLSVISETADFSKPLATFTYLANGQPLEDQLNLESEQIKQKYDFNSPLWLSKINQQNSAGDTLFGESLTYSEGGFKQAKYYDGSIASSTCTGSANYRFQYSYSAIGAIENAGNNTHKDWDLGVSKSVAYDANGNFELVARGGVDSKYNYFGATQRVKEVLNPANGSVFASYDYDQSGNARRANSAQFGLSKAHDLTFTYDPGSKMTSRIVDAAGGNTLTFRYGHETDRVRKDVSLNGNLVEKKLYIRGLSSLPLCELTEKGTVTSVIYIYGPSGLIVMRRDNDTYGVLKDHLGSIRAVLDAKAKVVANYDYLTFGALGVRNEPFQGFMTYLFTGQEFDPECELYNYRARFYSPDLGRFLMVDPQAQFYSPYLFCANNPVLFVDPTGRIATWARVLFGLGMAIIGIGVIALTIATGGAAAPAVAAWATGLGASAGVAAAVGTTAAIAASAALSAVSGAALGSATYALGASNEDFSWQRLGEQAALGAIAGAVTGGIAQGLSIGGHAIATAVTGVREVAAEVTTKAWLSFAARSAIVGGVASGIGGSAGSGVSGAVSNLWGLTNLGPGEMALSILGGLGMGALKGAAGGALGTAWTARIKAPVMRFYNSLSTKQVVGGGVVGGVIAVGGSYGYLYNREKARELG
jgi:large repetitive protein